MTGPVDALRCRVLAAGTWGRQFRDLPELAAILRGEPLPPALGEGGTGPKPEIIPANERRRAPLGVRLAVETSWQATQSSGIDPRDLRCVFCSGLGDTQLTDYLCQVLASSNKQLSPTKFHNSVHNAAAGYWTISTQCMQAANSVAGFGHSVALSLLEGITQCVVEQVPVLLTFYDTSCSEMLRELLHNTQDFGASLIIAPINTSYPSQFEQPILALQTHAGTSPWPVLADQRLNHLYEHNPAARSLALLQHLLVPEQCHDTLSLPLSAQSSLVFRKT